MTPQEAALIVARLVEAYPIPAWTDGAAALWVEMLVDLERDAVARVVRDMIASRSTRPSIADVRTAVASACADAVYLPADEAWGVVQRALGTVGRYRPFPAHENPLVAHVVNQIGWQSICDSESIETVRAQFRMAYTAALQRQSALAAASPGASAPMAITTRHEPDQQIPHHVRELVAQVLGEAER